MPARSCGRRVDGRFSGISRTLLDPDGAVGEQRRWHLAQGRRGGDERDARNVSGLMAALEREGLVKSSVDGKDRRKQIARLSPVIAVKRAFRLLCTVLVFIRPTLCRLEQFDWVAVGVFELNLLPAGAYFHLVPKMRTCFLQLV